MEQETLAEKKKKSVLRQEMRERTAGYILTALGLVAGLAWNDAVSSAIRYFFPLDTGGLAAKFFYAVIVTIVIVALSASLMKFFGPKDAE